MAGPKAAKKKKQQQKHGIDFKKIKRKVGKRLPPPKNSTNTEIKFKAIILPEQSVATEKEGSARSKKGLLLEDLLKQTSHHNSKVRRDALTGIRELLLKHPGKLKTHKFALIENLSRQISDNDHLVRETLFQLLKLVIFPGCKEDIHGLLSRMMAFIFNAMTHSLLEVQLMAFKCLDLVVQNDSSIFLSYAEKILQNYEHILRSNAFITQDKGMVKNALLGLVHCLSVMLCDSQGDCSREMEAVGRELLHASWLNSPSDLIDSSLIIRKSKDLLPVLVTRFLELLPSLRSMDSLGLQLLDTMLYILQSINLAVKIFITHIQEEEKSGWWKSQRDEIRLRPDIVAWDQTVSRVLIKLLAEFPPYCSDQQSAKNEERLTLLDAEITEIFFNFQEWVCLPAATTNKFLLYIEMLLVEEATDGKRVRPAIREKHLLLFFPYIPRLLSLHVSVDWKYRLLEAFTQVFTNCNPKAKLKLACIPIIEKMLIHGPETFLDPNDPTHLGHQITWIRELPRLLMALGDKHPPSSKVVLRLIRLVAGCAPVHPSILSEYESLSSPLQAFFSTRDGEGNICFGPFVRLPRDCLEETLGWLSLFSCVDAPLMKAITRCCCLCSDLDPDVLFRIIEHFKSSKNLHIGFHLSFFVTLLSQMKVILGKEAIEETQLKITSPRIFQKVTKIICRHLEGMGNAWILLELLEGFILDQLRLVPDIPNAQAMLQIICMLDSEPTKLSEESIVGLGDSLPLYLLDVARHIPIRVGETAESEALLEKARFGYLKPCYVLFNRSSKLLNLVLNAMQSLVDPSSSNAMQLLVDRSSSTSAISSAIAGVLVSMHKNADMRQILSRCQPDVDSVLQKISQASKDNKMTLEERFRVRCALDRLGSRSS